MYKILSGKEPAAAVIESVKERLAKLDSVKLVIVQVGENPASTTYVAILARCTGLFEVSVIS